MDQYNMGVALSAGFATAASLAFCEGRRMRARFYMFLMFFTLILTYIPLK